MSFDGVHGIEHRRVDHRHGAGCNKRQLLCRGCASKSLFVPLSYHIGSHYHGNDKNHQGYRPFGKTYATLVDLPVPDRVTWRFFTNDPSNPLGMSLYFFH